MLCFGFFCIATVMTSLERKCNKVILNCYLKQMGRHRLDEEDEKKKKKINWKRKHLQTNTLNQNAEFSPITP